ncbi:PP2C family protein-serine/threonine phosphatase [Azospirillum picis]|uniref:Sigma-B regulation protein RsbU (Phosphoserine phosphatase) n=1 Tax=Azospirillum picis TaxID=488438 RepID=A0ABU0MV96_9PROT|nr:SpoIIE family protein phosphatase [Azospirillum picis]MBP2303515.1 sigma-B regulation protein RsbU (phosphoserine phosphatase) [Azospirillum picis]MDQ0537418.1 sigma-B regulation protein RsbU (phosphoserine phosphatase) [Azospirillum picis]
MPNRLRVLCVDDSSCMRDMLAAGLVRLGYEVVPAADGQEALAALRADPSISLVISDWMMPGITGVDLCRRIRDLPRPNHIHVMLLTARQGQENFLEAMAAGADDFLSKPVDMQTLAARLRVAERILTLQQRMQRNNTLLAQTNQKLRTAYRRLQEDMEAAARVQRSLLPKPSLDLGVARFAAALTPSTEISGDVYNYQVLPDGSVAFYVLDVAGHGARAALMSVMLCRLLTAEAFVERDDGRTPRQPDAVVADLNRQFQCDDSISDYFTMICGILDRDGRVLRFCQAGHPNPVVLPLRGRPVAVGNGGFPVGLFPDADYETVEVRLEPGDRMFFYSDGVTECAAPDGTLYSQDRLHQVLELTRTASLDRMIAAIQTELHGWHQGGSFDDDVSIVAFETFATPARHHSS